MDVKKTIREAVETAITSLGFEETEMQLEMRVNPEHGDYSTNVAMVLFGKGTEETKGPKGWKSAVELGEKIADHLRLTIDDLPFLEKIEVVNPGFINFWLSKDALSNNLERVLNGQIKIAKSSKSKTILFEFGDPNPFKQIHIGHLRNLTLGESLARLLQSQGFVVKRLNYQGDIGMHVAKCLYGIQNSKFKIQKLENATIDERTKFLGECYAFGAEAYEENEQAKRKIQELNKKVYRKDPEVRDLWEKGRAWSLEDFEGIYQRLSTRYDKYYFESDIADLAKKIVMSHIKDGIFEKHGGAVVFRGERYGLHTRVFLTKEEYATYEGKDMALAQQKAVDFSYHKSIIMTAHEQAEYFKVVLCALAQFSQEIAMKTQHISFGFVQLRDGKMSSRSGNVITAEWLLDEAKKRLKAVFPDMAEETLEQVAAGAVKYSMLKFARASDISFSFDESITLEGNSGPYLQYTFARTQSVLNKREKKKEERQRGDAGQARMTTKRDARNFRLQANLNPEETLLLRQLVHFDEVVASSAEQFATNILCNYLFELAASFNNFYQKHKIVGSKEETFRIPVTQAVGNVLKAGLFLLGISAPERM